MAGVDMEALGKTYGGGVQALSDVSLGIADGDPQWNLVMAAVVLAALPPVLVILFMQRLFVKGLTETEK